MTLFSRSVQPGPRASAARWSVAAALAVAAGGLFWLAGAGDAQDARTNSASSAGSGVLMVAGQVTGGSYGLYLVDTKSSTICVYEWVQAKNKPQGMAELRLLAARNYAFDLQLDDYNNEKQTSPGEIRKLVEQQRRLNSATQPN
jgi:hypothetical protein